LEHLHLSEVCQRANPPVSLRIALTGKSLVKFVVENSGFVGFAGFSCEQKSNRQVWYGKGGEDWDLLGGRTHFDHWLMTMHLHYRDGDPYTFWVRRRILTIPFYCNLLGCGNATSSTSNPTRESEDGYME
jgi:hypothetical protein